MIIKSSKSHPPFCFLKHTFFSVAVVFSTHTRVSDKKRCVCVHSNSVITTQRKKERKKVRLFTHSLQQNCSTKVHTQAHGHTIFSTSTFRAHRKKKKKKKKEKVKWRKNINKGGKWASIADGATGERASELEQWSSLLLCCKKDRRRE